MLDERIDALRGKIEASGRPDSYISADEERDIFERGQALGLKKREIESALHSLCREQGWTRETQIIQDLKDHLIAATRVNSAVSQKEFYHCVNYGVSMRVPRKRALALCAQFVAEKNLRIKRSWLGLGPDWFGPLRRLYSERPAVEPSAAPEGLSEK
jgi:hypothetical protein